MKTIQRLSPIETAVHETLSLWTHKFCSWGMFWTYEDESGRHWEVAYHRDCDEVHVYTPNGEGFGGLDRVIGFEEWRTDVDRFATPGTIAQHLGDLPGW